MPVEIVLVRHGQSEGNRDRVFTGHSDSRLTARGHRQAEATAHALLAPRVDFIYSSDLRRCLETAAPLARLSGVALAETRALRERDVGEMTGLSFEQVAARWPEGWVWMNARDADYQPPGGESHRECSLRVGAFIDQLLLRHHEGRVVLFSHGVAINHMLWHLHRLALGVSDQHQPRGYYQVENCSLHRFEHYREPRLLRVLALNDTAHLAAANALVDQAAPME